MTTTSTSSLLATAALTTALALSATPVAASHPDSQAKADSAVRTFQAPQQRERKCRTAKRGSTTAKKCSAAKKKANRRKKKRTGGAGGSVHRGNYTCYQGGLTSTGSMYWGYLKVKRGNRYEIVGSKGKFTRKGKRLIWKSGSLKKWKWEGEYRTSRTAAGERQWQIDIIDRPNRIRIQCLDSR